MRGASHFCRYIHIPNSTLPFPPADSMYICRSYFACKVLHAIYQYLNVIWIFFFKWEYWVYVLGAWITLQYKLPRFIMALRLRIFMLFLDRNLVCKVFLLQFFYQVRIFVRSAMWSKYSDRKNLFFSLYNCITISYGNNYLNEWMEHRKAYTINPLHAVVLHSRKKQIQTCENQELLQNSSSKHCDATLLRNTKPTDDVMQEHEISEGKKRLISSTKRDAYPVPKCTKHYK